MSLDSSQQKVINTGEGEHLVLAPPGCGKTYILTERVKRAHAQGVDYKKMLCLTFTNRAARSMKDRIAQQVEDADLENMYVGNIHRFCARYLFEQAVVPAEVSVIDDDEVLSILSQQLGLPEEATRTGKLRKQCFEAMQLATLMHQIEHQHPKVLRMHPNSLTSNDLLALRCICRTEDLEFTAETLINIYRNARDWQTVTKGARYATADQPMLMGLLEKMMLADYYAKYKHEHRLLDFEDLLVLTYDALLERGGLGYEWCQVDEVQDLNALQLAILDLLMVPQGTPGRTLMYLGDEQQAIFSFMGAKVDILEQLKQRCAGHVYHLATNHRSPSYLLDLYNDYAVHTLGIDATLLPKAADEQCLRLGNELYLSASQTVEQEYIDVVQQAARLSGMGLKMNYENVTPTTDESTAIIVLTNSDADLISSRMTDMHLPHFKVSGVDLFSLPETKLLLSHLAIFANEHNNIAWARLLKGLHVYEQNAAARNFMQQLTDRALTATDLLLSEGTDTYLRRFVETYDTREIVVFDTETTGLDTRRDQIVQISAVKMRQGQVVEGSALNIFLQSDRPIPALLGDIVNPLIEEMKHHTLLSRAEGLQQFADYVGDAPLLAHNATFDINILRNNLAVDLPQSALATRLTENFDSLKLARMLYPDLHQYKLKSLLEEFQLEGENSHLADADVAATCNVVKQLYTRALDYLPQQEEFLANRTVKEHRADMQRKVLPLYRATLSRLHSETSITDELRRFYAYLTRERIIEPIANIEYALRFIEQEILSLNESPQIEGVLLPEGTNMAGTETRCYPTLLEQIQAHLLEISTLKESDLCSTTIVDERIFISTVHKAKGLEFDNVIVFDCADDRYPAFWSKDDPQAVAEDARKFYVAMTRAKRRLILTYSATKLNYHNRPVTRELTRFAKTIKQHFTEE